MSVEEDIHMALCVVKVLALVVIASSLLSISSALSSPMSSYGYATNGGAVTTSNAGKSWNVIPGPNSMASSSYLGPGYGGQTSQAYFASRYEPPVWGNSMLLSEKDQQLVENQLNDVSYMPPVDAVHSAAPPVSSAPAASGSFVKGKGYASDLGVKTFGYATNGPHFNPY